MGQVLYLPLYLFVVFIVAQYYTLKHSNIRFGLVMPFAWFAISLIITAIGVYDAGGNFQFIHILLFFVLNIPTGIMLIMMYIKNGKIKQKKNEVDISKIKGLDQ